MGLTAALLRARRQGSCSVLESSSEPIRVRGLLVAFGSESSKSWVAIASSSPSRHDHASCFSILPSHELLSIHSGRREVGALHQQGPRASARETTGVVRRRAGARKQAAARRAIKPEDKRKRVGPSGPEAHGRAQDHQVRRQAVARRTIRSEGKRECAGQASSTSLKWSIGTSLRPEANGSAQGSQARKASGSAQDRSHRSWAKVSSTREEVK